jgi:hypothetical protein
MICVWLFNQNNFEDYFIKLHNYFDKNYKHLIFTKCNKFKLCNIYDILFKNHKFITILNYENLFDIFQHLQNIKQENCILIPENFVLKNIITFNEIIKNFKNNIIDCEYEQFCNNTSECYTYLQEDWIKSYNMLSLPINIDILQTNILTFCPQFFNINYSLQICNQVKNIDIKQFYIIYSIIVYKNNQSVYNLNINSKKLYNKDFSMNVYNHNIPIQYKLNNCVNGLNNNVAFMYIDNIDEIFDKFYDINFDNIYKTPQSYLYNLLLDELKIYKTNFNFIRLL